MSRVLAAARNTLKIETPEQQDLRLAALLHDVGHYPYSHLMESVDKVVLIEDLVESSENKELELPVPYPNHEELGRHILDNREDMLDILGKDRAKIIADLFTRTNTADLQLSKLIHSTLDMDRLDYLIRDSQAAGVPYGHIDINYILNNIRVADNEMIGVQYKAMTAVEQFLFARFFMHKAVYYHKTTMGLETACRQLLRRCRDCESFIVPRNGDDVRKIVCDESKFLSFTDNFVDGITQQAADYDSDLKIKRLGQAIINRRPPKLLQERACFINDTESNSKDANICSMFLLRCEGKLERLSKQENLELSQFLIADPGKPLRLEKRGASISKSAAETLETEQEDELIKVFERDGSGPKSLVDISSSIVSRMGNLGYRFVRLYVIEDDAEKIRRLKKATNDW